MRTNNEKIKDMVEKQLKDINNHKKLSFNEIKRICRNLPNDVTIFDNDKCCIWNGSVANSKNHKKGMYVNFYYRGKKVALHRLLYNNYVENIKEDEYIKYTCKNKGVCCNINHMIKMTNKKNEILSEKKIEDIQSSENFQVSFD